MSRVRHHAAELEAKLEEFGFIHESQRLNGVRKFASKIKLVLNLIEKEVESRDDYQPSLARLRLGEDESMEGDETVDQLLWLSEDVDSMESTNQLPQRDDVESTESATEDPIEWMEMISVDDQLRKLELNDGLSEKPFEEITKDLALKEKQLEEKYQALQAKEEHCKKRLEEIKMKENQLEQVEKQYEHHFKEMEFKMQKHPQLSSNVPTPNLPPLQEPPICHISSSQINQLVQQSTPHVSAAETLPGVPHDHPLHEPQVNHISTSQLTLPEQLGLPIHPINHISSSQISPLSQKSTSASNAHILTYGMNLSQPGPTQQSTSTSNVHILPHAMNIVQQSTSSTSNVHIFPNVMNIDSHQRL
ncbi:hypothetical protein V6N11_009390 [Hibiscus sabdariffa]|uniref:Uncharacterized protein n=1 Tax=Hibiscus sabdariffa TaxID=183260 RepID=A0ABR2NSL9_9ROSI